MAPEESSRRSFMRAALAVGGPAALAACAEQRADGEPTSTTVDPAFPRGVADPGSLPREQHAWGEYLVRDMTGSIVFPRHQVFLLLEYTGKIPPTDDQRTGVETSLRTLERAFQWGTGGDGNAVLNSGLLFSLSYGPSYFDRFDTAPARPVQPAAETLDALGDDTATADNYDGLLHLGSDHAEVVLAAEEALFGGLERINGLPVDGTFGDVFEIAERRPGFVGRGLPTEKIGDDIPQSSPISMGFKSAFGDTLPPEVKMTFQSGPFAGGTFQHVSRVEIDLDRWYDRSHAERVETMFSPEHTPEEVGEVGDGLPNGNSGMTPAIADRTGVDADERNVVGHGQKLARVRDDDFHPIILRRGDFNGTAEEGSVLHFGAIQRTIEDFVETRRAMDDIGDEYDIPTETDGIVDVIEVTNRANFLMPPRPLRALPDPAP